MKRPVLFLVAMILTATLLPAWSPSWRKPQLPLAGLHGNGVGYCVSLVEGAVEIGNLEVPRHRINPDHLEEVTISTYNAVTRIALAAGRPDLADRAVGLAFVDPGQPIPEGATMVCTCSNAIWCNAGPGTLQICGCGGACGSCLLCRVPSIQ